MLVHKTGLLALSLLLAAAASVGQSKCLERTIPVSVSSHDGTAAPELTATNLEGTYRGKPVAIKEVELEEKPPRVILLVDNSGSMESRHDAEIDAAERLLSKLPSNINVGLAFFANEIVPVALPTTDRPALSRQLEALRKNRPSFKGKTALWSSVLQSVKMLGAPIVGDSIYLISDGGDNRSNTREESVEQALRDAGVRLFVLLLQPNPGAARGVLEDISGPASVRLVSQSTGGIVVSTVYVGFADDETLSFAGKDGKVTRFGQAFDEQVVQIFRFYRVEFSLPEAPKMTKDLKLDVIGFDKTTRGKLEFNYPATVLPCP